MFKLNIFHGACERTVFFLSVQHTAIICTSYDDGHGAHKDELRVVQGAVVWRQRAKERRFVRLWKV